MTDTPRLQAAVIILNYRTPDLVIDCLASLDGQLNPSRHGVVVVDNHSGDGSADRIEEEIRSRGWLTWARVERSPVNGGFAAGNNVGVRAAEADLFFLLNSDTIVRAGAIEVLLAAFDASPGLGLIGPRLEWPDGAAQVSTFRYRTPLTELISYSGWGRLGKRLIGHVVARPLEGPTDDLGWVSFACVGVRRAVFERIGLLDEGYFMYYEDMDFCRRATREGFAVGYRPEARVVHLRGGTSEVKRNTVQRKRRPAYYYAARARYFQKWYGVAGLATANLLWTAGWGLSLLRGKSKAVRREWADIWTRPGRGAAPLFVESEHACGTRGLAHG